MRVKTSVTGMNPNISKPRDVQEKGQNPGSVRMRKAWRTRKANLKASGGNSGMVLYLFGPRNVLQCETFPIPTSKNAYGAIISKRLARKL